MWEMSAKNNVSTGLSSREDGQLFLLLIIIVAAICVISSGIALAVDEAWEEQAFEEMELEQRALDVNEGELQLLRGPPDKPVHYHHNRQVISEHSLVTGWVGMQQCHTGLDRVPALQIVYNKARIRKLQVESFQNIESARVDGHTIQLEHIGQDSKICISAETRALHTEGGRYFLRNGPFMRQFLDGYYPLHVRIEIMYPASLLKLESIKPHQEGVTITRRPGYIDFEVWSVGRLFTEFEFSPYQINDVFEMDAH